MSHLDNLRDRVESTRRWLADARHEARTSPGSYSDKTAHQALEQYEAARKAYTEARKAAGLPHQASDDRGQS